ITVAWPLNCTLIVFEPDVCPVPQDDLPDAPITTTGGCLRGTPRPEHKSVAVSRTTTMAVAVAILAASLPLLIFICFAFTLTLIGLFRCSPLKERRGTQRRCCQGGLYVGSRRDCSAVEVQKYFSFPPARLE